MMIRPHPQDAMEIEVARRLRQEQEYGEGGGSSSSMTMFRVPYHVREANKELYEPRLMSIGPYYRGREALRAMEQHKWRYLRELVARASLAGLVGAIRNVERRARRCYSERTDIFDGSSSSGVGSTTEGDEFAEMLLLDGCFILQFFIRWHNREPDKLCDVGWALSLLHADLLLLENQIPFFVLEELFRVASPAAAESFHLRRLILPHFRLDDSTALSTDVTTPEIHHILHLFYEAFVPSSLRPQYDDMPDPIPGTPQQQEAEAPPPPPLAAVPSVTMLRDAGIRFKMKTSPAHMFDITFDKAKGVMSMPRIQVHQANITLLVNLIAFEQTRGLRRGTSLPLSSYAALMSFLVKTGGDVEQLRKRGILDNLLSSDDEAATTFQQQGSCSSLDYEQHTFAAMFADLNQYYESRWHKHRAKFLRDYCNSPWAIVAFVVAIFVFFFTIFKLSTGIYDLAHRNHHSE